MFTRFAPVAKTLQALMTFNNTSGWSDFANAAEQSYRQAKGAAPDPAKFCFNVWGVQIANDFNNGFLDYKPLPTLAPGESPQGPQPQIEGGTLSIAGSPVDFTSERDGQTLTLDHKTGTMSGDLQLDVLPFWEPATATFGAMSGGRRRARQGHVRRHRYAVTSTSRASTWQPTG